MYTFIENFMNRLTKEDVDTFAKKNSVYLTSDELLFTFWFIKNNWSAIIKNPTNLDLEKYKEKFSKENFEKIKFLFNEYSLKFKNYL